MATLARMTKSLVCFLIKGLLFAPARKDERMPAISSTAPVKAERRKYWIIYKRREEAFKSIIAARFFCRYPTK